jgi:hypothetical protein
MNTQKVCAKDRQAVNKSLWQLGADGPVETIHTGTDAIDAACQAHDLHVDWNWPDLATSYEHTTRRIFEFNRLGQVPVNNSHLVLSIYRYHTGRYEFTAYIS